MKFFYKVEDIVNTDDNSYDKNILNWNNGKCNVNMCLSDNVYDMFFQTNELPRRSSKTQRRKGYKAKNKRKTQRNKISHAIF